MVSIRNATVRALHCGYSGEMGRSVCGTRGSMDVENCRPRIALEAAIGVAEWKELTPYCCY
jgi:hypothetical protein